jgi:hypothetical protein
MTMIDRLAPIPPSQALCIIGTAQTEPVRRTVSADCLFVTQLLAISMKCEQYRDKRRASIDVALGAYGRAARYC